MPLDKEEFLQGLKDAGIEDDAQLANAPAPNAPEPVAATPEPVAPPVADPASLVDEPFPGWNTFTPEAKRAWTEREDQNKALLADINKLRYEADNQGKRAAAAQQRLAKTQVEYEQTRKRLEENERKGLNAESMRKLEEYRSQFPGESEMVEEFAKMLRSEQAQHAQQLSQLAGQVDALKNQFGNQAQNQETARELAALSKAHPDWRDYHTDGSLEVWRQALDEADKPYIEYLLRSPKASDNIHAMNVFKRDLEYARVLDQVYNAIPGQSATPPGTVRLPDLVADPNPVRRTTAPSGSTEPKAGQPISEEKRRFIEASEYMERQQKAGRPLFG